METKEYKGIITIGGKEYQCEVIDGIAYANGMIIDEFIKTLPYEDLMNTALMGAMITDCKNDGIDVSPKAILQSIENTENIN